MKTTKPKMTPSSFVAVPATDIVSLQTTPYTAILYPRTSYFLTNPVPMIV